MDGVAGDTTGEGIDGSVDSESAVVLAQTNEAFVASAQVFIDSAFAWYEVGEVVVFVGGVVDSLYLIESYAGVDACVEIYALEGGWSTFRASDGCGK